MAQTGDPTCPVWVVLTIPIYAEFSAEPFLRGSIGMARAQHPDSKQLLICSKIQNS